MVFANTVHFTEFVELDIEFFLVLLEKLEQVFVHELHVRIVFTVFYSIDDQLRVLHLDANSVLLVYHVDQLQPLRDLVNHLLLRHLLIHFGLLERLVLLCNLLSDTL